MEKLRQAECMRFLQIVMLVEVFFALTTAAEVCPYNTTACWCSGHNLTCSQLESMPDLYTGADIANITILNLWNGNASIPSNSLPAGLQEVYFNNQPLTNISDHAFNNSAQTLNSVTIIDAKFPQLPNALLVLTNLTSLHIENAPKENWNDSILEHIITNLTYLHLVNVGLPEWPDAISLSRLLVYLDLSRNSLKSIPDDAFLSFNDTLKELNLGSTDLTQIPPALSTLSNLTSLDLSWISLTNVSDIDNLASMPLVRHLHSISLESSGLRTIWNFSSFTSLREINLDNNIIWDVASGSFPASLSDLSLGGNQLASVPTAVANLPHLSRLDLSQNQISRIEPKSLPSSLKQLYLNQNRITVITNTTFENMANLLYLILSFNPISSIEPLAFSHLVSLEHLSISDTSLKGIPLAVTSLPTNIYLSMTINHKIQCPCPPPRELVDWFAKSNGTVLSIFCQDGSFVDLYLTTACDSTTTTTTPINATDTSPGGATALKCSQIYFLLLMTLLLLFFH